MVRASDGVGPAVDGMEEGVVVGGFDCAVEEAWGAKDFCHCVFASEWKGAGFLVASV